LSPGDDRGAGLHHVLKECYRPLSIEQVGRELTSL